MRLSQALATLGRNDTRLVGRDSFLAGMLGFVVAVGVVLRFALPWAAEAVAAAGLGFALPDYYPLLVGYTLLAQEPLLAGMIVGFLILDERDQNTLAALRVTPLPMGHYLLYRVLVPTALAFAVVLASFLLIGQALLPLWQLVAVSAGAAPFGAIVALFLAAFGENKVQGFALNKIVGTVGVLLPGAWFVPAPLQYLFGLLPPFWALKAYWVALEGGTLWPLLLGAGLLYSGALILWLARRFRRAALSAG